VCAPDKQHAYDAIELAYLGRNGNRKQAARKLAASRATFYRLVRRGVRDLAETLVREH
jgi:transcriptional regulator of acetoin/glycerol metabolism